MGSFYRSKHELVFVYKVGTGPHVNTVELGTHGRYRTNVWDYAGVNTWRAGRDADLEMHPTVKPTALVIDAIKDCSRRGDVVLDAFSGSGTTIIAAHKCRRKARALELDPLYVVGRSQGISVSRMRNNPIIVQKYGGACLETPAKIRAVASSLADLHSRGHRVVAIVSAMGKTTDELVKMAYQVSPHPNRRELDMLLTTGVLLYQLSHQQVVSITAPRNQMKCTLE